MSAVFDFDEADLSVQNEDNHDVSYDGVTQYDTQATSGPSPAKRSGEESGYASENDAAEPTPIPADEKLYEVELSKNFVASSVSESRRERVGKDDFEVLMLLGRGAYGKVTLCRHIKSQKLYAMKVLKKASLFVHGNDASQTKAERQILEEVNHPFIVQLLYAFQTEERLYLILQYAMGGELFSQMASEHMFSENVARFYIAELVVALEHLHSLGIVYRDLKPENCMLDGNGHILLTDFGLSKVALNEKANTICGTAEYMAPEILMEMHYDKSVDWWTLGILLYEMLTGRTPFRNKNRKKMMDNIQKKKLEVPYYVSADARDLLIRLLRKNPNVRLGSGEDGAQRVKSHPWFRKVDFEAVKNREVEPPIVPVITRPELAENFDEKFTSELLKETPVDTALDGDLRGYFENFSYVANPEYLHP
ncbi:kinase-like domain-containing protein [Syncephalastrum racemosum]|uniref:Kinase-like domain-containing protein n=1 Tax=Syncephalastrum racemosum TaxID=13706 RepID=A0A1X2GZJ7_SYNRA|nr:kinase-like domain-containing protein [Syncephalastrum racemosum]